MNRSNCRWRGGCGIILLAMMGMIGCASGKKGAVATEPIGIQLRRLDDQSQWRRYDVLLSFESESDRVFVDCGPNTGKRDTQIAHAGHGSLAIPAGAQSIDIKLSSLLRGRKFPGDWTLVGAYVYTEQPLTLHTSYLAGEKSLGRRDIPIPARQWTAVFIDLTKLDPNLPMGMMQIHTDGSAAIYLDDVMLVDNRQVLVDTTSADSQLEGWKIVRRGFAIDGDAPGRFRFALDTPESASNGWVVQQVNALRALFTSEDKSKTLCIYPDGRAFWDGVYRPMGSMEQLGQTIAQQHENPAEVQVLDESGKLNRSTPGDANHDGYNECRGAYQLKSTGSRMQIRLTPHTASVVLPVLEIAGLPAGKVQVTIEGRLVDQWVRMEDGEVLVVIPARIQRTTLIDIRVKGED
ncbi:MAG: hypothetical protein IT447_15600 [Phycisphaerales bacterium]|nr:hypothetical protein [Phycisphaerales bacterium]